jgi:nitroreductase
MLKEAALAILVCSDPDLELSKGRGMLDCSAATQNMLLAAHALGLGAVWLGIYPVDERINGMRQLLNMPSRVVPISLVSIGYPGERPYARTGLSRKGCITRGGWVPRMIG